MQAASHRAARTEVGRGELWPWSPQLTLNKPASHGWQLLTWESQQLYRVRGHRHQWGVCSGTDQCRWVTASVWGQTKTQGQNVVMCSSHSPVAQHDSTWSHLKAAGFCSYETQQLKHSFPHHPRPGFRDLPFLVNSANVSLAATRAGLAD